MNRAGRGWAAGAFALGAALLAVGAAEARRLPPGMARPGAGTANPSALVAAEIAFARMAREKGQWTAFREFADENAILFEPEAVRAKDWLKGRKDPPASIQWEPYEVWISCDGTLGMTRGGWTRPDGTVGWFSTLWKRQKNGAYRWLLDQGEATATAPEKPDFLTAKVADCPAPAPGSAPEPEAARRPRNPLAVGLPVGPTGEVQSEDGTLALRYRVAADHGRTVTLSLRKGEATQDVTLQVAPPAAGG